MNAWVLRLSWVVLFAFGLPRLGWGADLQWPPRRPAVGQTSQPELGFGNTRSPGRPVALTAHEEVLLECDQGSASSCCDQPVWRHRSGVFADFLYLRPGNVDVVYATEQTSFDPNLASPTGPVGRAAINGGPGFRVGMRWAWDDCTSLEASYTWFESDTTSSINATGANVLDLSVGHPSVATSGAASLAATATYDIAFRIVDVDYRHLLWGDHDAAIDYTVGVRYGHLTQDFRAQQSIFAGAGFTSVDTNIGFDGGGIHFGLDGIKRRSGTGWLLYAKADASFLAGEFRADFRQANQFGGAAVIGNDLVDYRVVTILETELGVGWESSGGRWRVTAGYALSAWLNTLTTTSYIAGVQAGSFGDLDETLTFDGLTTRIEWRY